MKNKLLAAAIIVFVTTSAFATDELLVCLKKAEIIQKNSVSVVSLAKKYIDAASSWAPLNKHIYNKTKNMIPFGNVVRLIKVAQATSDQELIKNIDMDIGWAKNVTDSGIEASEDALIANQAISSNCTDSNLRRRIELTAAASYYNLADLCNVLPTLIRSTIFVGKNAEKETLDIVASVIQRAKKIIPMNMQKDADCLSQDVLSLSSVIEN